MYTFFSQLQLKSQKILLLVTVTHDWLAVLHYDYKHNMVRYIYNRKAGMFPQNHTTYFHELSNYNQKTEL